MGGYAGYGASDPAAHNPSTYVTTLSGDLGSGTHAYHVVYADSNVTPPSGSTHEARANLAGFTIRDGAANGTGTNQDIGGGIFIDGGSPHIYNCVITANTATSRGGGVACRNTDDPPELRNCRILDNTVTADGEARGLADHEAPAVGQAAVRGRKQAPPLVRLAAA